MGRYDSYGREIAGAEQSLTAVAADTSIQTAIHAGLHLADPRQVVDRGTYAVVPKDAKVEPLDHLLPPRERPDRLTARVQFHDARSFVTYVNRFRDASTTLFADEDAGSFTAILDYHEGPTLPRWGVHVAVFTLSTTKAWDDWTGRDGKRMNQTDFAQFVEDHLPDIAFPPGADLLEMVKAFEVKKDVAFASAIRLDNGEVQLRYTEDVQGTMRGGEMKVPQSFIVALAPYEGTEPYRIDARFRYRMEGGRLQVWYDLLRIEDVERDAFTKASEVVADHTEIDVLNGGIAK